MIDKAQAESETGPWASQALRDAMAGGDDNPRPALAVELRLPHHVVEPFIRTLLLRESLRPQRETTNGATDDE
jgi:hypothetical protein